MIKKPKKRKRSLFVKDTDNAMSVYIRLKTLKEYGKCPFCGKPIECNFHFITRSCYATRWDEDNCIGSCMGCNLKMEYDPSEFILWYIHKYGLDAYENLVRKSKTVVKFHDFDLIAMKERFELLTEEMMHEPE